MRCKTSPSQTISSLVDPLAITNHVSPVLMALANAPFLQGVWCDTLVAIKVSRWPQPSAAAPTSPLSQQGRQQAGGPFAPYPARGTPTATGGSVAGPGHGSSFLRPSQSHSMLSDMPAPGALNALLGPFSAGTFGADSGMGSGSTPLHQTGPSSRGITASGPPACISGNTDGEAGGASDMLARCEWEAWLASRLRHPHVVATYSSFTVSTAGERRTGLTWGSSSARTWIAYSIMELCDAGTLESALKRCVAWAGLWVQWYRAASRGVLE